MPTKGSSADVRAVGMPRVRAMALRPYVTLLLLESSESRPDLLIAHLRVLLDREIALKGHTLIASGFDSTVVDEVDLTQVDALVYEITTTASWAMPGSEYTQTEEHIALLLRNDELVSVYCSESTMKNRVERWLDADPASPVRRVPPEILNAAYLSGPAKTMWLSGAHSPQLVKADRKVLAGRQLQDALDPLGDQTYYYTAARGAVDMVGRAVNVGCTPTKAIVWTQQSRSWEDYASAIGELLQLRRDCRQGGGLDLPFPVLASRLPDLSSLENAYEVVPPDPSMIAGLQEASPDDTEAASVLESALLEIVSASGSSFDLQVGEHGTIAGTLYCSPQIVGSRIIFDPRFRHEPN